MSTVSNTGTLSSTGIGSGLNVTSIVSQLVALEKAPLTLLATQATQEQAQISSFGQIQSQISALTDAATAMSDPKVWNASKASSSNAAAAAITATNVAQPASFSLDVDALAVPQSVSSGPLTAGAPVGAGTLSIQLGTWSGTTFSPVLAAPVPPATVGLPAPVTVSIAATDNVAAIAAKINAANTGVVATAFNDGTSDRLLLRSKNTGAAAGFQVTSADTALAKFVFDPMHPPSGTDTTMAANPVQYGQDAQARINGIAVTSSSNTLASNIPGVTINLLATTTTGYTGPGTGTRSPTTLTVSTDVTPGVGFVQNFVTAYNTLNATLSSVTKYDAATKTAGLFQGDSAVVGLQNLLRRMLGSSSLGASSQHLSDVGLELQVDGSLTLNTTKLSAAANNGTTLQQLFTANNNNPATNGFALKFRDFGKSALAIGGMVTNQASSLAAVLADNAKKQTAVNDHAATVQAQLQAQYSALDARMASLNAINAYVTQQVTLWNKSTA